MLEYTTHLVEAHPGIRTSFTENVLHVQEPTDFVNPDIPVSHSIQYSHRMSEDQPPIPPTSSSYHVQPPTDPIDATLISETPPDMADRVFDYNSPKDSIVSFIPYIPQRSFLFLQSRQSYHTAIRSILPLMCPTVKKHELTKNGLPSLNHLFRTLPNLHFV